LKLDLSTLQRFVLMDQSISRKSSS